MRKLILLLTLALITFEVFGASTPQTWKNTDLYTELIRATDPVKIGDGCFRFDSGQLESSNDCITYKKIGAVESLNDISDVDTTGATDGQALIYDFGTATWIPGTVDSLPTQTSYERQILRTDGTSAAWTTELQDWVASVAVPYRVGEVVVESGNIYKCITPNNDAVFDPLKWESIGGGSLPTDLVTTDETTILENFVAVFDSAAKKIKATAVSIIDAVVSAKSYLGNLTSPDNVVVQDGSNYNATDSTFETGASAAVSTVSSELKVMTFTPSATVEGSLVAFDTMVDPHYIKDHWYKVSFKYGISGTTDGLYSCQAYDNNVLIAGQSEILLPATNNQTKLATFLFKSPTSPTKIQVKCKQLVTTTETLAVTKLWYNAGDLTTLTLAKESSSTLIRTADASGWTVSSNIIVPNAADLQDNDYFSYSAGIWTATSNVSVGASLSLRFSNAANVIILVNDIRVGQATTAGAASASQASFDGELSVDDTLKFATAGGTLATQEQNISFTATPIASSTGIAASGEIDLSNYQYPQYDISSYFTGPTSITKAVARPERDNEGNITMRLYLSFNSANAAAFTGSISGILLDHRTPVSARPDVLDVASTNNNFIETDGTVRISMPAPYSSWVVEGEVNLSAWPTWATKKNSFSGTVVAPVAVDYKNSVKLEGNDGRTITQGTESYYFAGSGTGWTTGVDGSTHTTGNYYTVQKSDSRVELRGSILTTSGVTANLYLYKNGAEYKLISPTFDAGGTYLGFSYLSTVGEFAKEDKLSIGNNSNTRDLVNSPSAHYLNIVESKLETGTVATTTDVIFRYSAKAGTPASSTASCSEGTVMIDASYIYVCRATDTWVRSPASTW